MDVGANMGKHNLVDDNGWDLLVVVADANIRVQEMDSLLLLGVNFSRLNLTARSFGKGHRCLRHSRLSQHLISLQWCWSEASCIGLYHELLAQQLVDDHTTGAKLLLEACDVPVL